MTDLPTSSTILAGWESAEIAALTHMKSLGFIDAHLTKGGADGGIDVESIEAAAQVKFWANPVGRPDVQRIRGAAHSYRLALFYSTGGYTKDAIAYADQAAVALFHMDVFGQVQADSAQAAMLVRESDIQDRRERLEELEAQRYRFVETALQIDHELFLEFGRRAHLKSVEASIYPHVANDFYQAMFRFQQAVRERDFQAANTEFAKALSRKLFLHTIAGELTLGYSDLAQAVHVGHLWGTSTVIEDNLHAIGKGITELNKQLRATWEPWEWLVSDSSANNGIDATLSGRGFFLAYCAIDPTVLPVPMQAQVLHQVQLGLQQANENHKTARRMVEERLGRSGKLTLPPTIEAELLYTERLFQRLFDQTATVVSQLASL